VATVAQVVLEEASRLASRVSVATPAVAVPVVPVETASRWVTRRMAPTAATEETAATVAQAVTRPRGQWVTAARPALEELAARVASRPEVALRELQARMEVRVLRARPGRDPTAVRAAVSRKHESIALSAKPE
jgi:hypothetical protein